MESTAPRHTPQHAQHTSAHAPQRTHAPEEGRHGSPLDVLCHDANDSGVTRRLCDHAIEAQHVWVVEVGEQRGLPPK